MKGLKERGEWSEAKNNVKEFDVSLLVLKMETVCIRYQVMTIYDSLAAHRGRSLPMGCITPLRNKN